MTRPAQQQRGGNATRPRVPQQRARQAQPRTGQAPGQPSAPSPGRRQQPGGRRTAGQPLRAAWDPAAEDGQREQRGHRDPDQREQREQRGHRDPDQRDHRDHRDHPDRRDQRGRPPRSRPQARRRPGFVGFLRYYGWRVYALPVLVVLTVLALLDARQPGGLPTPLSAGGASQQAAPTSTVEPTAAPTTPLVPNPEDNPRYAEAKAAAELPAGGPFTERGTGTYSVVAGTTGQIGTGQLFTYTVEIEDGVQLPGGPEGYARTVDATLANPKSWIGSGKYAFQRIDSGVPKIRITLASQQTARGICGFKIQFDASCWRGGRTILNVARWERGAVAFQGNVVAYQQYVVNHEVGHGLGFGHRPCTENGGLAPIMMQQTWGVSNDYLAALGTDNVAADGKVCQANPWPYPTQAG